MEYYGMYTREIAKGWEAVEVEWVNVRSDRVVAVRVRVAGGSEIRRWGDDAGAEGR